MPPTPTPTRTSTAAPAADRWGGKTVWGLDPFHMHARFWASRGVQVVRLGERSEIVPHADLFLLTDPRTLAIFRLAGILDGLSWIDPGLVAVRLIDSQRDSYHEQVVTDPDGRFLRFKRIYEGSDPRVTRVGLTHDRELATVWQQSPDAREGWRRLRRLVRKHSRYSTSLRARVFDATWPEETGRFVRELVRYWRRPDATITGIRLTDGVGRGRGGVWVHESAGVAPHPGLIGPLWVGAGRRLEPGATAVGPGVMWDSPEARPAQEGIDWLELEPISASAGRLAARAARPSRPFKRLFDVVFSLLALLFTLPLYPLIALAIIAEDGFPVFFTHRRETIGGREFACLKFRSMRRDAEEIKSKLVIQNRADGPQFYIPDDPRLTRVGRLIRRLQIDEVPQFINVLKGEMSVVGPRPSPFKENQYCPPWREARLSVRPGVTGLWQISRTRAEGADFQEWIKYDIEYVERQSLALDLWIIWQTVLLVFRKVAGP
jgi:lipopolysaccharide/colanic/teichoic acid biosynthesis glycosyltransferase